MKTSVLVLVLLILVGFGGYSLIVHGDLPQNLTSLLEITVGAIAGVNAFSFIGNGFGMNKTQNGQMPMQNNMYGQSYNPYSTPMMNNPMNQPMMNQNMQQPMIPVQPTPTQSQEPHKI